MRDLPELRAPRVSGDMQRPEITIKPRFDLAADLGVTTAALSQTIRIATLGDIDQNSAKFSLSDRQIPIQRLAVRERARATSSTLENLPVPTVERRLGAAEGRSPTSASAPARPRSSATTRSRRIAIGADLAPGLVTGDALDEDQRPADGQEPAARASQKLNLGRPEVAGRADPQLHHRA